MLACQPYINLGTLITNKDFITNFITESESITSGRVAGGKYEGLVRVVGDECFRGAEVQTISGDRWWGRAGAATGRHGSRRGD